MNTRWIGMAATMIAMGAGPAWAACGASQLPQSNSPSPEAMRAAILSASASAALGKGDAAKAVKDAEAATMLLPNDAGARALLGRAYLAAGRFRSADTAFADVLTLDPSLSRVLVSRALAQIALGDADGARASLAKAEGVAPDADIGLAEALLGDTEGARQRLNNAARATGADARTRQNLSFVYALDGRWVDAVAIAQQDVPSDQMPQRLRRWAMIAQMRADPAMQVGAILGVLPAADNGQPAALALVAPAAPVPAAPVAMADATPTPSPVATPAAPPKLAEPVVLAAAPTPAPVAPPKPAEPVALAVAVPTPAPKASPKQAEPVQLAAAAPAPASVAAPAVAPKQAEPVKVAAAPSGALAATPVTSAAPVEVSVKAPTVQPAVAPAVRPVAIPALALPSLALASPAPIITAQQVVPAPQPVVAVASRAPTAAPIAVSAKDDAPAAAPSVPAARVALLKPGEPVKAVPAAIRVATPAPSKKPVVLVAQVSLKPTASRLGGNWVVQLGAFSSLDRRATAWTKLSARAAFLTTYKPSGSGYRLGKAQLYRLSVSGLAGRKDAVSLCVRIKQAGGDCFVRNMGGDQPMRWAARKGDDQA